MTDFRGLESQPRCSNCGSVDLYLVRQGEYSFKACKDCEHEDSYLPPNKDMESAKIGDADNG